MAQTRRPVSAARKAKQRATNLRLSAQAKAQATFVPPPRTPAEDIKTANLGAGRRGPPGHRKAVLAAHAADRRERAWALLKAGATFKQISAQLGVSVYTAHADCAYALKLRRERLAWDADQWRALHVERAEAIVLAHSGKALRAPASAQVVLKALEYEARLIPGLAGDADGRYSQEQVMALMLLQANLFMEAVADPERRAWYALELRRKVGSLGAALPGAAEAGGGDGPVDPAGSVPGESADAPPDAAG